MVRMPPDVRCIRQDFEQAVERQLEVVSLVPNLRREGINGQLYPLRCDLRERMCEMALVSMSAAWEEFLECAFLEFLVSGSKLSGLVTPFVSVDDSDVARSVVSGGRAYAQWLPQNEVRARAARFFKNGEPFNTALAAASVHIGRIQVVRNRAVHDSRSARKKFAQMKRDLFGSGHRCTPGGFLLGVPPHRAYDAGMNSTYPSMFALFADVLRAAAAQIIPDVI